MTGWVGTSSGRKQIEEIYVGTASGRKQVQKAFVGTASGNKVWYERTSALAVTATASRWDIVNVAWGASATVTVTRDGVQVWSGTAASWSDTGRNPSTKYTYVVRASNGAEGTATVTTPSLSSTLSATAASSSQINLSWTQPSGLTGWVLRSSIGQVGTYGASTLSASHTGLAASTAYNYAIDAVRGTQVWQNVGYTATTTKAPTIQQKVATLGASSSGSYSGNTGAKRTDTSNFYSGYYSGTWGQQGSAFMFAIPGDLRNCVSVDKVEISIQNVHSYSNGGVTQHLAVSHTQTAGSSWPGATGAFGGRATAKGGWYGGAEWVDITRDVEPTFGDTVAENFRVRGAWGICLVAPSSAQGYYSYWSSSGMRLRITYTVKTG